MRARTATSSSRPMEANARRRVRGRLPRAADYCEARAWGESVPRLAPRVVKQSEVSNEAGSGRRTTSCSRPSSPSRKDDDEEPLKATLEDARPGRVDRVLFGTVARRDGVAVLRGRSASVLLKAHAAYDLPLNASVAIDGCGLRKRPRDQSHQILVAARHRIICEGDGVPITIEAPDDAVAASLFGEVLDVRRADGRMRLLLVDDVDRGPFS